MAADWKKHAAPGSPSRGVASHHISHFAPAANNFNDCPPGSPIPGLEHLSHLFALNGMATYNRNQVRDTYEYMKATGLSTNTFDTSQDDVDAVYMQTSEK
jgi:hypothetical protein